MEKIPPRDCLGQTRTARIRTLPACVDAARLMRAGAAKHRSVAAAGLAGMLSAAHKGRALLGGCLTQAYNADARTGRKPKMGRKAKAGFRIGPSKRNMPPPARMGLASLHANPLYERDVRLEIVTL